MILESKYQAELIKRIKHQFPGAIILKNDPNYLTGFPDLLFLYGPNWAALEVKRSRNARQRPNQEFYVDKCFNMSYGAFIYPENETEVLNELRETL